MYKMRNDALVTRVRNTPLAKEPTLDDVLKHIPGMKQTADGTLEVNGLGAPTIYLNDKKATSTELSHRDCDGDVGILDIMKAYHDCGYQGYMRPDHGRHIWGEECRPGYGLYDRALGIMYLWGCWDMLDKTEGKV